MESTAFVFRPRGSYILAMATRINRRAPRLQKLISAAVPQGFTPFVARRNDLDDIEEFSHEVFADNPTERKYIRHLLSDGHAVIFGLKKGEEIAACCTLEMNVRQGRIYIVEIAVHANHRGRGLGQWTMKRIEALANSYDYRRITSHVTPGNRMSLSLHRRFGMRPQRLVRRYFHDGHDAYYMQMDIQAAS